MGYLLPAQSLTQCARPLGRLALQRPLQWANSLWPGEVATWQVPLGFKVPPASCEPGLGWSRLLRCWTEWHATLSAVCLSPPYIAPAPLMHCVTCRRLQLRCYLQHQVLILEASRLS